MITADIRKAAALLFRQIIPRAYERPAEWASRNIRFTHEKDPIKGALDLSLTPYLIDPINAWELRRGQGLKEVTVVAPEQTGKSLSWECGELWSLQCSPGLSLIYYTSDKKAERINEEKIEPLLKAIHYFAELLELPGGKTIDHYRLGESLSYFSGVGSRISSFSARRTVADELDDWKERKGHDALDDLRKRARAFRESLCYKVCTPKGTATESRIWQEFLASSQGYWHLRCQHCGELTIRSCDIFLLQFETADDRVVPGSCRLQCPRCHKDHFEEQKSKMNLEGDYIHKFPALVDDRPGFQWGALASVFVSFGWEKIAASQLLAGKTGSLEKQIYVDNSVRGLPFKPRKTDTKGEDALRRHAAPLPEPEKLLFRFLAVDTQDDGFFWIVRGVDAAENTYLLGCGKADCLTYAPGREAPLEEIWNAEYHGGKCICGIIDEGGHRVDEVREFARKHPGLLTYKGNTRIGQPWKESTDISRLLLVNAEHYRLVLLHAIYWGENRGNSFWFLPQELPEDYKSQLLDFKPNKSIRNGDALENYISTGNDHFFDCEKMALALMDFFKLKILPGVVPKQKKVIKRV